MKGDPLADPRTVDFLRSHGWSDGVQSETLGGGGRHKVLRLTESDRSAVLKIHETPAGSRDAFARELLVHGFISEQLPADVPKVLGADQSGRAILFEWIEGEKVSGQPSALDVARMAEFIIRLNQPHLLRAALDLPEASDAGFDLKSHHECARRRVETLLSLNPESDIEKQMRDFVRTDLEPALAKMEPFEGPTFARRSLSPSDFGFHNVLVRPDGTLCFTDFEHAGWDDAAKLSADFLLQPDKVLTAQNAETFLSMLCSSGVFGSDLSDRVHILLPIQKVKWTTIILNVFHRPDVDEVLLSQRLQKATEYWAEN